MARSQSSLRLTLQLVCAALFSLALTLGAEAQQATSSPSALTTNVVATITPQMGDLGGKFFGATPDPTHTHHYYIAAEPELWNFAPQGEDPVCARNLPSRLLLHRSSWKIRYVQYADANFTARVLPAERLGIMGPVLRGVTGDYIEVTFLNRGWRPLSMHPHGVSYDKDSEGSYYRPSPGRGAAVAPGAKFTYVWHIGESAAPLDDEPSSKAWLYHSHVVGDEETNLGLVGCIIVTDPKRARPDGTPRDVDREMATLFTIFNEARVGGQDVVDADDLPPGAVAGPKGLSWTETQQAVEEGQRYTINGRTFGNLAGLEMNEGEKVRWYLFGLGSEEDFHTAHWHGLTVVADNRRRTDVVELLPASMRVADMVANVPGSWLFHCHVAEHMSEGMFTLMTIHPANAPGASKDPEIAFLGMPQSLVTLRIRNAVLSLDPKEPEKDEIELKGEVTVPEPFPAAQNDFVVQIGDKNISLRPDASGLSVAQGAMLLITNTSRTGNGIVSGGTMKFELTLSGEAWLRELEKLGALKDGKIVAEVPLAMRLGEAHHAASVVIKLAGSGER